MKFYYGIKKGNKVDSFPQKVTKGSYKTEFGRLPNFCFLEISNYHFVKPFEIWIDDNYNQVEGWESASTCKDYSVPQSLKAFRRHVRKLLERQSFPKGTVIQLSGRFQGIGYFCII